MMAVKIEISKAFNKHAADYQQSAKAQIEIGERLFDRLQYLKMQPKRILDLGCGPGTFSRQLALNYPKAQIVGVDLAYGMLLEARKKHTWRRKWPLLAADMNFLPFASGVFDLVFANQVIHWGGALAPVFRELNRVMSVNGCFMFTTLGPDTFKELKTAWADANHFSHVNEFPDMHDVGDLLMAEHFLEPVMDMEFLSMHYDALPKLVNALQMQGVRNINPGRNPGLTGKSSWKKFEANYGNLLTPSGKYPLTYEVVYGHAWKGEQRKVGKGIETLIPISHIQKR